MAIENLTAKEEELIRRNRKLATDLPTYYDAQQDKDIPISRDFEAFLITKNIEDLKEGSKWLERAKSLSKPLRDRDALLQDTLVAISAQTNAQLDEWDSVLQEFTTFLSVFPDVRFSGVPEVGQILTDLQELVGEQVFKRDQSFYMSTFLSLLSRQLAGARISKAKEQQLESWAGPLSAYIAVESGPRPGSGT